jgi:hypothetical protein
MGRACCSIDRDPDGNTSLNLCDAHKPPPSDAARIAMLEAQVAELQAVVKASNHGHTAKAAELEASLCEVRAHVRASNMQKPRAVRE